MSRKAGGKKGKGVSEKDGNAAAKAEVADPKELEELRMRAIRSFKKGATAKVAHGVVIRRWQLIAERSAVLLAGVQGNG